MKQNFGYLTGGGELWGEDVEPLVDDVERGLLWVQNEGWGVGGEGLLPHLHDALHVDVAGHLACRKGPRKKG